MIFDFRDGDYERFRKWDSEHYPKCRYYDDGMKASSPQGAIGGRLTYCFTPTSIGLVVKIKCACGDEINCTDYSSW